MRWVYQLLQKKLKKIALQATSALDNTTERVIQDTLKRISSNRTTLVIAHRLSTIIDANLILVMKEGRIVERGSHTQLLANVGGEYYKLWMEQLDKENHLMKVEADLLAAGVAGGESTSPASAASLKASSSSGTAATRHHHHH